MLIISRKKGKAIHIAVANPTTFTITVVSISGSDVKIGFDASADVTVIRDDAKDQSPRSIGNKSINVE